MRDDLRSFAYGGDVAGWVRALAYLAASVPAVIAAFFLGMAHYERNVCNVPEHFDDECDLAGGRGLVWAAAVIVVVVVGVAVIETLRRRHIRV